MRRYAGCYCVKNAIMTAVLAAARSPTNHCNIRSDAFTSAISVFVAKLLLSATASAAERAFFSGTLMAIKASYSSAFNLVISMYAVVIGPHYMASLRNRCGVGVIFLRGVYEVACVSEDLAGAIKGINPAGRCLCDDMHGGQVLINGITGSEGKRDRVAMIRGFYYRQCGRKIGQAGISARVGSCDDRRLGRCYCVKKVTRSPTRSAMWVPTRAPTIHLSVRMSVFS